jgi:hypothetical protein
MIKNRIVELLGAHRFTYCRLKTSRYEPWVDRVNSAKIGY